MGNITQGTAANVLVGPARLLVAPSGSTLPTWVAGVLTWDPTWLEVGYTDKGTDLAYTPTVTDIDVDEETAPVKKILTKEKAIISCSMAEATLKNISRAISASIFTATPAGVGTPGLEEVDVGTGTLQECMVGLEGISPKGFERYIVGYRALAQSAVKMAFQRTTKTSIPLELDLLADSSKALGKRLYKMVDKVAAPTS